MSTAHWFELQFIFFNISHAVWVIFSSCLNSIPDISLTFTVIFRPNLSKINCSGHIFNQLKIFLWSTQPKCNFWWSDHWAITFFLFGAWAFQTDVKYFWSANSEYVSRFSVYLYFFRYLMFTCGLFDVIIHYTLPCGCMFYISSSFLLVITWKTFFIMLNFIYCC